MHSLIAPSMAGIWGPPEGCRAAPFIALKYPQEPTLDDQQGTAAHELGTAMIKAHVDGGAFPLPGNVIGHPAGNGIIIDRDIYDSAQIYASDVVETIRSILSLRVFITLEQRITCPSIHPESFGTYDCCVVAHGKDAISAIYLWEYKNGHVDVDPFENWQCINYLSGIMDVYEVNGLADQRIQIVITVVQPNAYHNDGPVKRWTCRASDLRPFINILHASAEEVYEQQGRYVRSGKHCRFCPGRFACTAFIQSGMALYESAGAVVLADDVQTIGTHYAIVTEAEERIRAIRKGLEAQIEPLLRSGQQVPGVHLGTTLSRSRDWTIPESEILAIGDANGINLRNESCCTPPEAERAGLDKDIVGSLSKRRETGLKVEKDDLTKIRRIFYGRN
jgi:hypothetical protein